MLYKSITQSAFDEYSKNLTLKNEERKDKGEKMKIIKRDGTVQPFDAYKLNKWVEWATEDLQNYVDWTDVVLSTVARLPKELTSQDLQRELIRTCLDNNSWSYNLMAGRLYAALTYKELYNNEIPTIKELHQKLVKLGLMKKLNFTDSEYEEIEKIIDHSKDFRTSYSSLQHIREKYALQNRVTNEQYESQQFTFMRMAMALAEDEKDKINAVKNFYEELSDKRINAPTPNYVNLGTPLRGYASCMVYSTLDTAKSLAVGDHIAYTMTCQSAGIGSHIRSRSLGDEVRGGAIKHQGKLPYLRALEGAVHANLQSGRGGACTTHINVFDPEIEVLLKLKNPMSTTDRQIRGLDYSLGTNKFFAKKAAKNEEVFTFNTFTAPDLYEAFYSGSSEEFEELYKQYENNPLFPKKYINAREVLISALNESYETGRMYLHFVDEMNSHTPFLDRIYMSNLCQEINLPTIGYKGMEDLYSNELHRDGEIGLCSLAGINVDRIESDEQYEKAMYFALKMIDKTIDLSEYPLPHLGQTAKARRSAGVGIIGLAHYLAQRGLSYSSQEGLDEIHRLAERHMYFAIKASLRLAKELGPAKWMDRTKWVKGWLPIDSYNKNVDEITSVPLQYDWESLRAEIIENGGIRNSVLVAHMPSESSSLASETTNGLYPVRDLTLIKGDANKITYWAAPNGEILKNNYESAWDIPTRDLIKVYAIVQKFTDQGISADLFADVSSSKVSSTEMLRQYFDMVKYGLKSRYYMNTLTTRGSSLDGIDDNCDSCTL